MKVFNGALAGFTLASMILDWSGLGSIMALCVGCYVFGYAMAREFWTKDIQQKKVKEKIK